MNIPEPSIVLPRVGSYYCWSDLPDCFSPDEWVKKLALFEEPETMANDHSEILLLLSLLEEVVFSILQWASSLVSTVVCESFVRKSFDF